MRAYNYVFFNSKDDNQLHKNPDGYYTICAKDLENQEGIILVSYPLDYAPTVVRFLYGVHHTIRINKYINLPLKKLWFPYYFQNSFSDNKPICFVLLNAHISNDYLDYIKKEYPNCKIVCVHRDLISVGKSIREDFCLNPRYDAEFSYDQNDCDKYGLFHFDELESKISVPVAKDGPIADVFFAGKAKDRFPRLLEAYKHFTSDGLSCKFYIVGVPKDKRVALPGIQYADKNLSYRELLYYTVNSKCILEISQEIAVGYSARFLEAVIYSKKLITDNISIKESKFYYPQYIQCFKRIEDIDTSFVTRDVGTVDYHYNNEFSPLALIDLIDETLVNKAKE